MTLVYFLKMETTEVVIMLYLPVKYFLQISSFMWGRATTLHASKAGSR